MSTTDPRPRAPGDTRGRRVTVPRSGRYEYVGVSRPVSHKKLVLEYYRRGLSYAQIEMLTGVPISTARGYCVQEGLTRCKRFSAVVRRYTPSTPEGRARLDLIRRVALDLSLGVSWREASRIHGVRISTIGRMMKTPYARALRAFVFGNASTGTPRPLALDMHFEMGLPSTFIASVVDRSVRDIDAWIATASAGGRRHGSAPLTPQGRTKGESRA